LRSGAFPLFEIAYVWVAAVMAVMVATRMIEKNMHLGTLLLKAKSLLMSDILTLQIATERD